MIGKKWEMLRKHPEDIIGAARTMGEGEIRLYHDPIPHWVPAAEYLGWARRDLKQEDLHGRDSAVCYGACLLPPSTSGLSPLTRVRLMP
jgi:hypothetical protein